ncbi:MAG: hypothetical protein WCJ45_01715 [bacterium]
MNTLGTAATTVKETFRDLIVKLYQNPFISKLIAVLLAIFLSLILVALSKILATYLKNKITRNFIVKGNKDIENVSALIGDIIYYVLVVFSLFIGFSIVGLQVGLILG